MFKAQSHYRYLSVLVIGLLFLAVSPIAAGDIVSGSTSALTSISGTLTFDWQHSTATTGNWSDSQSLSLLMPLFSLPSDVVLTSATLQLSASPDGQATTDVVRSENDYQYISGYTPIYQWRCFHYGMFGCDSSGNVLGQNPIWGSGYGGSAQFFANYGSSLSGISSSLNSVSISTPGTYDLLALGFGNDLLAGNQIVVDGNAFLDLQYQIDNYGYQSSTGYTVNAQENGFLAGTLTINYEVPAPGENDPPPVPEPASLALLGTGLGFAGWLRRRVAG